MASITSKRAKTANEDTNANVDVDISDEEDEEAVKKKANISFSLCRLFTIRQGMSTKEEMVMIPLGRLGVDKNKDVAQKTAPH